MPPTPDVGSSRLVRPARLDDAPGMARVHIACWREAYAHLLSDALLTAQERQLDGRTAMWRRVIDRGAGPVVAEVDGLVVGLAVAHDHAVRPGPVQRPDDEHRPAELELRLLYLLAAHHGSGLGQGLLDAVTGDRPCFLWVAQDNPRARAFYARNGFHPDGASHVETGWEDLREVRLVRA